VTPIYDQNQEHRLVGVTRKKVKGLKRLLKRGRHAGGCVGPRNAWGWLTERLPAQQPRRTAVGADPPGFYHASERVGDAASATAGTESPAAKEWLAKVLHTLRHEGHDAFFQQLLDWRAPLCGSKREAADELMGSGTRTFM
jgi:hypothetical protein